MALLNAEIIIKLKRFKTTSLEWDSTEYLVKLKNAIRKLKITKQEYAGVYKEKASNKTHQLKQTFA